MAVSSVHPGEKTQGGEIAFRRSWEALIFFGGLTVTISLLVIANFVWS